MHIGVKVYRVAEPPSPRAQCVGRDIAHPLDRITRAWTWRPSIPPTPLFDSTTLVLSLEKLRRVTSIRSVSPDQQYVPRTVVME